MAEATDDRLRLLVERIERIDEDIAGLREDRKEVFAEAKAVGYDSAILRQVIARRAMDPADRAEADLLVETYEAALGGQAPDPAVDRVAAARELAVAVLSEQIEGIDDAGQARLLVEHVTVLLDIRAEIAELRRQEAERKKLAKGEGFLVTQLSQVVRWLEKCARHGGEAMRAGEAVFQLYRGTVEGRGGGPAEAVSADPKLQATFGKRTAADRKLDATMAWLETGMGN